MFEFVGEGKNVQNAKCKICGNIYSAESKAGITHLLRHRQKCLALHKPVDAGTRGPDSQMQNARQHFVKMIMLSELPFSFAQNVFFKEWVQKYIQPQFHSISRIRLEEWVISFN